MSIRKNARIYVAGHRGLVGSAVWRELERQGFQKLIGKTRAELDLRDPIAVARFFDEERPEYVYVAAAKVGGILANETKPADFLLENLQIQNNLIGAAHAHAASKLLFLGSSCIYPKLAPQPLKEDYLLTGPLEPTNQWYAVAKIAGIKLCQAYRRQFGADFISAMPTNLYGPNDNYDLQTSHVLAGTDSQVSRSQRKQRAGSGLLGHGSAAARVFACGRSGVRLPVPHGAL